MSWVILALWSLYFLRLIKTHVPSLSLPLRLPLAVGLAHAAAVMLLFVHVLVTNHVPISLLRWEQAIITVVGGLCVIRSIRFNHSPRFRPSAINLKQSCGWLVLGLCLIPLFRHAMLYPHGGWDAWSVWNLKARFLILADDWTTIFNPLLWRSSPHYPLFLPLVITHHWLWDTALSFWPPLINALVWAALTAGLLAAAVQRLTEKFFWGWVAALVWLSHPLIGTNIISQYADVPLGFWFLAACATAQLGLRENDKRILFLAGLCASLAAFTKSEGGIFVLILAGVLSLFLFDPNKPVGRQKPLLWFYGGTALGLAPSVTLTFITPPSQTFVNGLVSVDHPASWNRLIVVLKTAGLEWTKPHWMGLFYVLSMGVLLAGRRLFDRDRLFIPLCLCLYLSGVCFYYWINTYFDVGWWMNVSFYRIVTAVLPVILYWMFVSLAERDKNGFQPLKDV